MGYESCDDTNIVISLVCMILNLSLQAEHSATVVDSRCVLIGYDETATKRVFSARETLAFTGMDESSELEHGIRGMLADRLTPLFLGI